MCSVIFLSEMINCLAGSNSETRVHGIEADVCQVDDIKRNVPVRHYLILLLKGKVNHRP